MIDIEALLSSQAKPTSRSLLERVYEPEWELVQQAVMNVVDSLQRHPPAVQVQGAAFVFLLLLDRYKLPAHRVLEACARMMRDAEIRDHRVINGMRNYMKHELDD